MSSRDIQLRPHSYCYTLYIFPIGDISPDTSITSRVYNLDSSECDKIFFCSYKRFNITSVAQLVTITSEFFWLYLFRLFWQVNSVAQSSILYDRLFLGCFLFILIPKCKKNPHLFQIWLLYCEIIDTDRCVIFSFSYFDTHFPPQTIHCPRVTRFMKNYVRLARVIQPNGSLHRGSFNKARAFCHCHRN